MRRIQSPHLASVLLPALLWAALTPSVQADIYMGTSKGDVPMFSDRPAEGLMLFIATDDLPSSSLARHLAPERKDAGMRRHSRQIELVAAEQGIDPALVHAVVQVESGYDARAVSPKGAVGLMQLMPATARRFEVTDRYDPAQNLRGGTRYLRTLLDAFDHDLRLALAAYNAGEGAVLRHALRVPPYRETVSYVEAVLRRYRILKAL